ncbi:MAG: Uncharacterised protein [Marinobacterium sp. xm-d-530]|jgi:hypothetical protein|nr:MAG: Uncharacterised protein [Marinobacterium sp. xm-d-530]
MKKALAPTATVGTSNRSTKLIVALSNIIERSMSQSEAHKLLALKKAQFNKVNVKASESAQEGFNDA